MKKLLGLGVLCIALFGCSKDNKAVCTPNIRMKIVQESTEELKLYAVDPDVYVLEAETWPTSFKETTSLISMKSQREFEVKENRVNRKNEHASLYDFNKNYISLRGRRFLIQKAEANSGQPIYEVTSKAELTAAYREWMNLAEFNEPEATFCGFESVDAKLRLYKSQNSLSTTITMYIGVMLSPRALQAFSEKHPN